jgi:hypothetical protein
MNTHRRYFTGYLLIALAALTTDGYAWQPPVDTPIIIVDGSLTMESAVPWSQFSTNGNRKIHPHSSKAVTSVEITMPGNSRTIAFSGERCSVLVRYGSTDITVETANGGKGLRVATDFSAFTQGGDDKHMAHKDAHSKISRVTVTKGNQTVFDAAASGGTKVVVHYQ